MLLGHCAWMKAHIASSIATTDGIEIVLLVVKYMCIMFEALNPVAADIRMHVFR